MAKRKAREPGIVAILAKKYGTTPKEVKRAIMKAIVGGYKILLDEAGLEKGTRPLYYAYLRTAAKLAWKIAKEQHRIPTAAEVAKAAKAANPGLLNLFKAAALTA